MTARAPITLPTGVLAVRRGPGANCSSIGSVVDLLFASVVVGGVVYAAVAVSLGDRAREAKTEDGDSKRDPKREDET